MIKITNLQQKQDIKPGTSEVNYQKEILILQKELQSKLSLVERLLDENKNLENRLNKVEAMLLIVED